MAIKKRAFARVISDDAEQVTVSIPVDDNEPMFERGDGTPVYAEDLADTFRLGQEADVVIAITKRTPPRDPVEAMRLDTYCLGNERRQLHPKDESTERLLAGVRYVQNAGKEAKIEKFYRDRIRSPLTAIRAFMVLAADGPRSVNDDTSTDHPLWLFRSGKNPFYGKLRNENEEGGDDD